MINNYYDKITVINLNAFKEGILYKQTLPFCYCNRGNNINYITCISMIAVNKDHLHGMVVLARSYFSEKATETAS